MKKRTLQTITTGVILTLWSLYALSAEDYPQGIAALERFDPEIFPLIPLPIQLWLVFLVLTLLAGLIFVRKQPIARWVSGGFIVSLSTGHLVFEKLLGLPMLSGSIGLWHVVCWTPGLVLLLIQRPYLNADESRWFRIWSGTATAVILFSFVFDIRDAIIYINHFSGLSG